MEMKRKRGNKAAQENIKRVKKTESPHPESTILKIYYPQVLTLREYLLQAAKTSKTKRRRILNYGMKHCGNRVSVDAEFVKILDTTLVGLHVPKEEKDVWELQRELGFFTQRASGSTVRSTGSQSGHAFAELVEFAIWLLFKKNISGYRPSHILCQGYLGDGISHYGAPEEVKGLQSYSRNEHVDTLKSEAWGGLPALVGAGATKILVKMLQECGIFVPLEQGKDNYLQLSGTPLSELRPFNPSNPTTEGNDLANLKKLATTDTKKAPRDSHNLIRFIRHRILYRKSSLNARSEVSFGLPRIHILNRTRSEEKDQRDTHVMQYIFPRQFGLHNVFTSGIDKKDTAQPFKDYTIREHELRTRSESIKQRSLPKRLRGDCQTLIKNLRTRHEKCAYSALLRHYCPVNKLGSITDNNVMSMATSPSQVSAFCRAVVIKVFPGRLWGEGESGQGNKARIMHQVDRFIRLGRYESLMLHEALQDIKISVIPWLRPPNETQGHKMAASDFAKRKEIFAELVYYLFDSFIIPLIGNNFYVTESSSFRNRLFYFRHDVWKRLSTPALSTLTTNMFEELGQNNLLKKTLSRRAVGTSRVRLLPKETGLRPIINLRRRVQSLVNGKPVLGRSVNSILTSAFQVLNYEKATTPAKFGASMFSADDIYPRLRLFRSQLEQAGNGGRPLYFAKLDVQSCFDTIPHEPLMHLLDELLSVQSYGITRHAEAKALGDLAGSKYGTAIAPKPVWKYRGRAQAAQQMESFQAFVDREALGKKGTVFVDNVYKKFETRTGVMSLLGEHIERNVVQIGKKFYRQKIGIPQGSIVSSLLCNFFYADLEKEVLDFVHVGESVLLRLIDDFLLISTNRHVAHRFVNVMHAGIPRYGLKIKSEKTKVNFDMEVSGTKVPRLSESTQFPYCGNAIDTRNLNISKDEARRQQNNLAASVTVEYSRLPGQNFYRKTFSMLKLHMHAMHMCTEYNHVETVIANVFRMFADTAERCFHYIRSLPRSKKPGCRVIIKTIDDLINVAFGLMQRKRNKGNGVSSHAYACTISKSQTRWLACQAFERIFGRRQTGFCGLLCWLRRQMAEAGLAFVARDRYALEELVRRI